MLDFREFSIEINPIFSVDGSSIVKRLFSKDKVTCSVKYDISSDKNDSIINLNIDFSNFQTHVDASKLWIEQNKSSLEYSFTSSLHNALQGALKINDHLFYKLYIDVMVESSSETGNLIDLISYSIFTALKTTSSVKVIPSDKDTEEFDITEETSLLLKPENLESLFISVSLFEISDKIYCFDASDSEELSALSSISIFFNAKEELCGMITPSSKGGIKIQSLKKLLSKAKKMSKTLFVELNKSLQEQAKLNES